MAHNSTFLPSLSPRQCEEVWTIASGTYMKLLVNYSFPPQFIIPDGLLKQKVTGVEPESFTFVIAPKTPPKKKKEKDIPEM